MRPEKILDHKWLDPECIQNGCQSLIWKGRYESAVKGRADFRQAMKEAREKERGMANREKAPVQGYIAGIPWAMHLRAWDAYAKEYGRSQTAERMAERGGFHAGDLDDFIPGWREELSELATLRSRIAALEAENAELKTRAEKAEGDMMVAHENLEKDQWDKSKWRKEAQGLRARLADAEAAMRCALQLAP